MNLTDRYPRTKRKLYFFEAVENKRANCYNVAISKWSDANDKHIFEDHLSCQTYIDILGEPDMVFDALFEDSTSQDRDLIKILKQNGIKFTNEDSDRYYGNNMTQSIAFPNKTEAEKCVKLLQDTFKFVSP